ncbi:MAG: hypothetical protein ACOCRX_09155 [Candidatus Woesearchaeota archaeon]
MMDKLKKYLNESNIDVDKIDRLINKQLEPSLNMLKKEIKMYDSDKIVKEWSEFMKIVKEIDSKINR